MLGIHECFVSLLDLASNIAKVKCYKKLYHLSFDLKISKYSKLVEFVAIFVAKWPALQGGS